MPSNVVTRGPFYGYTRYSSGLVVPKTSPVGYSSTSFTSKDATVRRVRPADLWVSGTARTTHSWTSFDRLVRTVYYPTTGHEVYDPLSSVFATGAIQDNSSLYVNSSNLARARLLKRIKAQNLNLAQAVAEYRQTCNLFATAARDVISAFRSLRSGRAFSDIVRYLQHPNDRISRSVANRWLSYQYGLKPLISDIYGAAEALAVRLQTGMYLYVRSSATDHRSSSVTYPNQIPPSYVTGVRTQESFVSCTYFARYKIREEKLKSLSQIGLTNPALLVWELIPYSFVVDWLIPVGSWLSNLDALAGTSDLTYRVGYKETNLYTASAYGGTNTMTELKLVRSQGGQTNLSLPRLSYQPSTSFTAVVNGLALLTQLRSGISRTIRP